MSGRGRHALHLVRRFFAVLGAKALDAAETAEVEHWLTDADNALFWHQDPSDQRHALETARAAGERFPEDRAVIRAALFHDVGKIHSGLGPFRRSLATLAGALRTPMPRRWARYRNHGPLGARDLEAAGAEALVVEFARLHPGAAPAWVDRERWQALLDADAD